MRGSELMTGLEEGLRVSFIDCTANARDESLKAEFLTNSEPKPGSPDAVRKVSVEIENELRRCTSFDISVAFITDGGLSLLLQVLRDLEERGVPGRILTTDYNYFNDPAVLKRITRFRNIETKIYRCGEERGFHAKGYIFHGGEQFRVILGSSNMTAKALTTNSEWNVRLVSTESGSVAMEMALEFEDLWTDRNSFPAEDVLDLYAEEWKSQRKALGNTVQPIVSQQKPLTPNSMQKTFVGNLLGLVREGKHKALLISATGTGKTYAAAFAVKELMDPSPAESGERIEKMRRVLFVVHREQIVEQARASFMRVIGTKGGVTYTKFGGDEKERSGTLVFATIQTLSRESRLKAFERDAFHLVIIDEVHRAGAASYKKIMAYFRPQLWLGMTASPDRPDGEDIYALFDHNIVYEIRLQDALSENLLCPFRYFGICDVEVDERRRESLGDFSYLTTPQRVEHILREADFYGFSGRRVKGLIFCSRVEECRDLSRAFNARGLKTVDLSGSDSVDERRAAVKRLAEGEGEERLDYIFTVDIFNEGVDIPEINQVILLRETQSPIVFVQQLGRGLRRHKDKNFVVILDFIGNYENNYLIPVALSGDYSYNKDGMRKYVTVGNRLIPGESSIQFQPVARERILRSIDSARTSDVKLIRDSYNILRRKLGRTPRLEDFDRHNGIDPLKIFQKFKSYHNFLRDPQIAGESGEPVLGRRAGAMLEFLSQRIGNAKRLSEAYVIGRILDGGYTALRDSLMTFLRGSGASEKAAEAEAASALRLLSNSFEKTKQEKEKGVPFVEKGSDGEFRASKELREELREGSGAFREQLRELVDFVFERNEARYGTRYKDTALVLYEKYTYEDVCRLLNWDRNMNGQNIGGYFYDSGTRTLPVFINYSKDSDAIAYEDRFESDRVLVALSKTKRRASSPDADHIYKRTPEDLANRIFLFVRRNKDDKEAKDFYFLGEVEAEGAPEPVEVPASGEGKPSSAFEIRYRLETPVRGDVYEYITGD